ncbi:CENP-Q, a CENPA-CAD centromere complex subunit-domain-containing protein [Yarrowia lipolytica]|uniref:YALI0B23254p n=2 Tax=Yarrowia lipolytica TaxID=4952 RepID=Q6CDK4_YARLI|nr:YALI0B23254p [Yarrowia lipolytica CLIB122]AOW02112.1 hypothetical protein YALI1_B30162g [Yarrowia lipolytica]KAB8283501.1 CENP-Q, a CENPA-CAD centromere complex subunit-domain-containing protein [Yarrowia lipolytica]KAE8173266.1 CENP-Q, a CENPA-CAD centromere complex subunit-domain-containing protein [Yarrowia lipolytica]KAJ8052875.1 CENP-Q, a CENPA-CAD centromere complex subunit-domain-containing protein [Yarrowia lipolytica]RDW24335.1 CENP-Q, a CENPA-CAD centromere complex subunit-domain-|eukprot:XP_501258.1 YALI0B23254p [Yarrowia lipolytica CLIB122]
MKMRRACLTLTPTLNAIMKPKLTKKRKTVRRSALNRPLETDQRLQVATILEEATFPILARAHSEPKKVRISEDLGHLQRRLSRRLDRFPVPKSLGNNFDASHQYTQMEKLENSGAKLAQQIEALQEVTRRRTNELARTIEQHQKLAQKSLQLDNQIEERRGNLHALLQGSAENVAEENAAISYRYCERDIDKEVLEPLDQDLTKIVDILDHSRVLEVSAKVDEFL